MIDHLGITCTDLPASAGFYDRVLGILGHRRLMDSGEAIGYGTDKPDFWIARHPVEGPASVPNREIHLAFSAADAATVRAFFEAGTEMGAAVLHEPRLWPEYHDRYFAAVVRDLDGNNLEAVCHTAEPGD